MSSTVSSSRNRASVSASLPWRTHGGSSAVSIVEPAV